MAARRARGDPTDLAYPAIDAAALTVVLLVISRRRGHVPPWYLLVSASFLLVLLTDTATAARPTRPPAVADGGYYLQLGLVGAAARAAARWPPTTASPERLGAQWAVYVPFALAIAAAVYDFWEHGGLVAPLFLLAVLAVCLVVTRTVLLLGENARLAAQLRESAEFKTKLLRFVSHEIANPLSPCSCRRTCCAPGRRATRTARGTPWPAASEGSTRCRATCA